MKVNFYELAKKLPDIKLQAFPYKDRKFMVV